jgi:multidrug transporter EmrE-like cation transporter
MTPIPRSALILGLAGLIPFLWGTATELSPSLTDAGLRWFGPRFIGPYVGLAYGTIILSFMSGVLWGFVASRATGQAAAVGYALSTLPALWAFFFVGDGPVSAAIWLAAGFLLLLLLDFIFWERRLAPDWWLRLRLILTSVVIACLTATAFG